MADKTNILLVDDDPKGLLATEVVLSELKQTTIKAKSGKEALRLILEYEFAVILLDVRLPDMGWLPDCGVYPPA